MGCHFLLQGIFPTQGLNLGLLHCRQMLYRLSHGRSPLYSGLDNLNTSGDYPGGPVNKNLPANAGDVGSIPGPGRSAYHRATKPLCHSPCACALEPQLPDERRHHSEKGLHHNWRLAPLAAAREKPHTATKTQHSQQKYINFLKFKETDISGITHLFLKNTCEEVLHFKSLAKTKKTTTTDRQVTQWENCRIN